MNVAAAPSAFGIRTLRARHGLAVVLAVGSRLRLTNIHGTQVVDLWAFALEDPSEHSAMDHTRSVNSSIFLERGMAVVSQQRRPLLTLVDDSSPGRHDTLLCPCNAALYRELSCADYHRSCADNLHEALAALGVTLPFTPASLNLFMNVPVREDGGIERRPPAARPGDHVVFRAERDVIVAMSACPQDITPINGAARTPQDVALDILPAVPGTRA